MNTTVAHLFRQLRKIAAERPDCINTDLIDEVEQKATELSLGSRIEGKALMEVWRLVKTHIKPPRKLMPRIVAELKHWKCKDIKVTVASHYSTNFTPTDTDNYPPFCFAYNVECTRHVGGKCFFRILIMAAFSDIMDVINNGRFDSVCYRLVYGTGNVKGVEFPEMHCNILIDDHSRVRNDMRDALIDYHRDVLWRANENDERFLIENFLNREYDDKAIYEMNERADYYVSYVQEYMKTHTLLDGYVPTPSIIHQTIYQMRRRKVDRLPKTTVGLEHSPVVIHNGLDPQVPLFDPQGNFVGYIKNITALYDIKLQIRNLGIGGYYMYFCGQKINIDHMGAFDVYPLGFYDAFGDTAAQLV